MHKLNPHTLGPIDVNQRYTIDETCAYLRKCRAAIYSDIKNGMPVIKDGRRTYVPGSVIAARSTLDNPPTP